MFLYKMRLKTLLRNKTLVFWTMIFPLLLATLFFFAFKNINSLSFFKPLNVALVDVDNMPETFVSTLKSVTYGDDTFMFNITENEEEEAKVLLNEDKITGYIIYDEGTTNNITLVINDSGIDATILKSFLDEYIQTSTIISSIMYKTQGAADINALLREMADRGDYLQFVTETNKPNQILLYFYSLIAMALINSSFWGTLEITNLQPNLSITGIRLSTTPIKKYKLLLANILAAFTIHISIIAILLFYINLILGITFGASFLYVVIVSILGSLTGISFGALLAISLKKAGENLKVGICTATGLFGGMLSGMMYPNIKFWVDANIPVLSVINPVNIITDSLFSLYYYSSLDRFLRNILILCIMTLLFTFLTLFQFRRDKYESI